MRRVVTHRIAGLELSNFHDWGAQVHDRLRLNCGGTPAPHPVEKDSWTHEIPDATTFPCERRAVVCMEQSRPRRQAGYRFAKAAFLRAHRPVIQLGRMKVGERA